MNQVDNKQRYDTKTIAKKILDFLLGFLGSLILANLGIVFIGQFDTPERLGIIFFLWFWRFASAGLAVFFFTKKRIWISIGLVTAILTASNIFLGLVGLAIMLLIAKTFWNSMPL